MDFSILTEKVANFAPHLGALLGGPAGAGIGALIANKFGTENTPEAIYKAIEADPDAGLKLRQIEADNFKVRGDTLQAMLLAESKSKHTTRPKIAYQAFQVVSAISLLIVFGWVFAVITDNETMVNMIVEGWPFVAAIIFPFIGWLNNYFGVLRKEDKDRLDAATGNIPTGLISTLVKKFK